MITHAIYGPPGTGKTTRCISIVEHLLNEGASPDQICFITFTRKGAKEARERAMVKFKLEEWQLPWFRTIHSLAFGVLGKNKSNIMGFSDYCKISQQLGLYITFKGMSEDGTFAASTKGDRLFFMEAMARSQMIPLKKYWEKYPDEDIHWYELELLQKTIAIYKKANFKQDFTDLLYEFIETDNIPPIKYLIVDEAQDLTPLQWKLVDSLSRDVEQYYVAGDDDQALFKWAGADVSHFISLPGTREVLPQSYRVPSSIQAIADTVVKRINSRVAKQWNPRPEQGVVEYHNSIESVNMDTGTWLLLARNVYLLQQYNDHCIQMGYVFSSTLGSPVASELMGAIRAWEKLRRGDKITAGQAKVIYTFMATKERIAHGSKTILEKVPDMTEVSLADLRAKYGLLTDQIWHIAMDKIGDHEREYFISALRRGEKLQREPRIKIETIHAAKGGEADNVVLITDMADRTYQEYVSCPDDEHRVWYVGVTRAKQALHIITPRTNRCYDI